MGDRCFCRGYVLRAGWPRFKELTEAEEDPYAPPLPGLVSFEVEGANYALSRELGPAVLERLVFYSFNGPGDEYRDGVSVSVGDGMLLEADTSMYGHVTITLSEDGELDLPDLQIARKVCRAIQTVRRLGEAAP